MIPGEPSHDGVEVIVRNSRANLRLVTNQWLAKMRTSSLVVNPTAMRSVCCICDSCALDSELHHQNPYVGSYLFKEPNRKCREAQNFDGQKLKSLDHSKKSTSFLD
jgi:hypothetical protein